LDDKPTNPESTPPPGKRPAPTAAQQMAMAMELPFVLVSAIVVGGLMGYFLDRWLHTKPILMLVFGALGFFAGVRDVLRRLPGNGDGSKGR
jgi:F0F1-type ATP synthase assembly protein I